MSLGAWSSTARSVVVTPLTFEKSLSVKIPTLVVMAPSSCRSIAPTAESDCADRDPGHSIQGSHDGHAYRSAHCCNNDPSVFGSWETSTQDQSQRTRAARFSPTDTRSLLLRLNGPLVFVAVQSLSHTVSRPCPHAHVGSALR